MKETLNDLILLFDHALSGFFVLLKFKPQKSQSLVFLVSNVSPIPITVPGTLTVPCPGVNGAP